MLLCGILSEYSLFAKVPGLEVIKLLLCSTQLSMKFILLINVEMLNVEMPTIVGILIFISRINTKSGSFKARKKNSCFSILVFMSS